jgi:hypothetical protein
MIIKRGGVAKPISGNIQTREIPDDCPKCSEVGLRFPLKQRVYLPDEFGQTIIPADANLWKQCHHCGYIIAKQDITHKGQLTTDIEKLDSRFQTVGTIATIKDERKGIKRRGQNERERRGTDFIKDADVRKEMRKGAKLISYSET